MSGKSKPAVGAAGGNRVERGAMSAHPSYSTVRAQSQPVHACSGQVVGQVLGGVFSKTVRASVHFLRRPPAIAFDMVSLREAWEAGARAVDVHDVETGRHYMAGLDVIRRLGFELDRGFGRQVALPLERWTVSGGRAARQLALLEVEP